MGGGSKRMYTRPVLDYPADKWRSTYYAHTHRNPPSKEPGVDYYCPLGTTLVSLGDGVVSEVGGSIYPATGRFVKVNLDNGQSFRLLHLGPQHSLIPVGRRVSQGQPLAISGASGYGSEYFGASSPNDPAMIRNTGGPHSHASLFPTHSYNNFRGMLDLEEWIDEDKSVTRAAVTPEPEREEEDMPGIRMHHQVFTNGDQAFVVETETGFFIPDPNHFAALVKAYEIDTSKLPWLNEYDWFAVTQAKAYSNSGYPAAGGVTLSESVVQTIATTAAAAAAAAVPEASASAVADAVEAKLLDDFAKIPAQVADEQRDRLES